MAFGSHSFGSAPYGGGGWSAIVEQVVKYGTAILRTVTRLNPLRTNADNTPITSREMTTILGTVQKNRTVLGTNGDKL